MSIPDPDLQLTAVRRAFDAAFGRMATDSYPGQFEDELSNLLCQLYRLAELCKKRQGVASYYAALAPLGGARAALWVRSFDTHEMVVSVSIEGDFYTDYYTDVYPGYMAWKPRASYSPSSDKHGNDLQYESHFEGRRVSATIRSAFDQLVGLAQEFGLDQLSPDPPM